MSTNVGKEIAHIPVRCIEYHSIGSLFFILKRLQRLSSFDVTVPLENMRVPGGSDSRMQLEINIQYTLNSLPCQKHLWFNTGIDFFIFICDCLVFKVGMNISSSQFRHHATYVIHKWCIICERSYLHYKRPIIGIKIDFVLNPIYSSWLWCVCEV